MKTPSERNRILRFIACAALVSVAAVTCARDFTTIADARIADASPRKCAGHDISCPYEEKPSPAAAVLAPNAAQVFRPKGSTSTETPSSRQAGTSYMSAVEAFASAAAQQQAVQTAPSPNSSAQLPQLADGVVYSIAPSDADPEIKRFNANNLALFKNGVAKNAKLLVYFSGTGGTPASGWLFLEEGAKAGYRVIGLMYDNAVSDPQTCGPNPDPACSDRFRQKRIFGDDLTKDIDDLPAESVVNRLTKLLQYLDAHHHEEGWSRYLHKGEPEWSRIAVAGHSQGGGVAAYIAKKKSVYRVINLSGAWDRTEGTKEWAPWITLPSATPMGRWYAAYHQKESHADAMKAAYAVLKIPSDHIRVLTLEPNPQPNSRPGADVYHGSMISAVTTPRDAPGNPAYAPDWAFFLGAAK